MVDRYSVFEPSHLRLLQEVECTALRMLHDRGWESLSGRRVLDVGCGNGYWLRRMLDWGGQPQDLVGLDARADRVRAAADGLPARSTLCCCDAAHLPWPDDSFDMVSQFVVFSSILDSEKRVRIAAEMLRVLRPDGLVLWYDFHRNSPRNHDVAPVPRRELAGLFPPCDLTVRSVTLVPPVARWFGERAPWSLGVLSAVPFLRTHHVAVMRYRG
jgi:ubiquinone/menaquinone biosynthesis C-methylase UbiE